MKQQMKRRINDSDFDEVLRGSVNETVLSERSSDAVLNKLSDDDPDRPDLGFFQYVVIGALLVKKTIIIILLLLGALYYLR